MPISDEESQTHGTPNGEVPAPNPANAFVLPVHVGSDLCSKCNELGLEPESFIVSSPGSAAERRDRRVHSSRRPFAGEGRILRTGGRDIELGSISEIHGNKSTCRFCKLLIDGIGHQARVILKIKDVNCFLRWEVDGHGPDKNRLLGRTRRLRVLWKAGEHVHWEYFLILVAHSHSSLPNSEAVSRWRPGVDFLGRKIEPDKGKQALIKSWLGLCDLHHTGTCSVKIAHAREFGRLLEGTYFGVVDVQNMRLSPLPKSRRYAALSYVWGDIGERYQTSRSNAPIHQAHGGLELKLQDMPKVVRHAIRLVQQLGLQYIWVDSLCIVQDSKASFRMNTQAMHAIYGNADFTICAADGEDANAGLIGMYETDLAAEQPNEEIAPGLELQVVRSPEMVVKDSKWDRRAWTFQERMLSRRCVIFAERKIYFECRQTSKSEDIHNEATGRAESLGSIGAPLRNLQEINSRAFSFYMKAVQLYYRRELTRPGDVLSAWKGVETLLQKNMGAPFCYGLPTSHFDLALLWMPTRAITRRKPENLKRQQSCTIDGRGYCACPAIHDDMDWQEFPSWSWSGWFGGDIVYDETMLEGCLQHVRGWLTYCTWIEWHIRDGTGCLRPLWDKNVASEDTSEQEWRGYRGVPACEQDYEAPLDAGDDEGGPETDVERRKHRESRETDDRDREAPHPPVSDAYSRDQDGLRFLHRRPATGGPPGKRIIREPSRRTEYPPESSRNRERVTFLDPETRVSDHERSRSYGGAELGLHRPHRMPGEPPESPPRSEPRSPEPPVEAWPHDEIVNIWGRAHPTRRTPSSSNLKKTLPEIPYGVCKTEYNPQPSPIVPDMPILQFFAQRVSLQIFEDSFDTLTKLTKCHVGDSAGDWCGTVTVNTSWFRNAPGWCHEGKSFHFIALSKAMCFSEKEAPNWNYLLPSERGDSKWQACHVLLIEQDTRRHVWERVGIGKVFAELFEGDCWEEILLG